MKSPLVSNEVKGYCQSFGLIDCLKTSIFGWMMDDLVHVSVSSVLVARSRITWELTTTNRYYLGEHTQSLLMDTVNNLGEI